MPKKPLFWISGNYYERQKKWAEICSVLADPNIEILDCGYKSSGAVTASEVILLLKQKDMFDSRPRIIKLKGVPENYRFITDYFYLINDGNVLVIEGDVGYRAKPPEKKFINIANSKFYKTFKSHGTVFHYDTEVKYDNIAAEWVARIFKDLGKSVDSEAIDLLVRMKGRHLDTLYCEITKLCNFQIKKKIKIEDVQECCLPLYLSTVWQLLDNLDKQDYEASICQLQKFYQHAGSEAGCSFYGDIQQLLGAMNKHYTFLMMLRDTGRGAVTYDIAKQAISNYKKRTKKGEDIKWESNVFDEWWMKMQIGKATTKKLISWPLSKIYNIKRDINRCIFICRVNSASTSKMKICLDTLIMLICDKISILQSAICKGHQRWRAV